MERLDGCQRRDMVRCMKKQIDPVISAHMKKIGKSRWKGMDKPARSEALRKAWITRKINKIKKVT